MANLCENILTINAQNAKGRSVIKYIKKKIKNESGKCFLSFICPDYESWGTKYDVSFRTMGFESNSDSNEHITLYFDTNNSPSRDAVREFQERMEKDLTVSLIYVEPLMDFIGFYRPDDEGEMGLSELYYGLVHAKSEAQKFAKRLNMTLEDLAEDYMCNNLDGDDECYCPLCEFKSYYPE